MAARLLLAHRVCLQRRRSHTCVRAAARAGVKRDGIPRLRNAPALITCCRRAMLRNTRPRGLYCQGLCLVRRGGPPRV